MLAAQHFELEPRLGRYLTLLFDLGLYVLLIMASVAVLIGICIYSQWLLVPWIALMAVDIVRGLISVLFIFVLSHVRTSLLRRCKVSG